MNNGNQSLKPLPSRVRLILDPRKVENVERVCPSGGWARRVVKLYVRGTLLSTWGFIMEGWGWGTLDGRGRRRRRGLRRGLYDEVLSCTYSRF